MVRHILALVAALTAATQVLAAPTQDAAVKPASVAPAPPPVEDYGKLPGMDLVTLSPSGQRYAFVATLGEKRKLFVSTTDNQLLSVNDVGSTKIEGLEWAGDDHLLVKMSATVELGLGFEADKDELGAVTIINLKSHLAYQVFGGVNQEQVAHTVAGTYGVALIDGHWYGYFGGYTYSPYGGFANDPDGMIVPDLYKVDLDNDKFELAAKGDEGTRDWLLASNGQIAARMLYNRKNGDWRVMPGKWGGVALASGRSLTEDVAIEGFGRSTNDILVYVGGGEDDTISELPLAGGPAKKTYTSNQVGSPLFDRTTKAWIGSQISDDDDKKAVLFDALAQAKLRGAGKAFPGYFVHLISYSADFNRMIVFTDGGDDSGTYWIVDIAKHSAEPLGSVYPTVTPKVVGPVRWVDYKAADGLAMRGVLTLPPGLSAKNLPIVVMPHGGPEDHDQLKFDYWAQAFASRGYAVFQPNFRGSDGQGNAFLNAGFGQWGRKMQTDISDGVAELARQGLIDPKRACIVGWSYGGYAALAGVTVQHGLYRCAFSYGGISDLPMHVSAVANLTGGDGPSTRYVKKFMGVTTTWETELRDISPARLADRADAPVMLIHGKDDTVVSPDQSDKMARALTKAGKPVQLITLTGADHWLLHEDVRIAMVKASVEFVMKNNPPDPPPTIASPAAAQ